MRQAETTAVFSRCEHCQLWTTDQTELRRSTRSRFVYRWYGRIVEVFLYEIITFAGEREAARLLMSKFAYGNAFFQLNEDLLERYATCRTGKEVIAMQETHLNELKRQAEEQRNAPMDLPPSGSSSEDDE